MKPEVSRNIMWREDYDKDDIAMNDVADKVYDGAHIATPTRPEMRNNNIIKSSRRTTTKTRIIYLPSYAFAPIVLRTRRFYSSDMW